MNAKSAPRDRPDETEIEITVEMIEAGAKLLCARDDVPWGPTGCEIVVETILRAALRVPFQNCVDVSK